MYVQKAADRSASPTALEEASRSSASCSNHRDFSVPKFASSDVLRCTFRCTSSISFFIRSTAVISYKHGTPTGTPTVKRPPNTPHIIATRRPTTNTTNPTTTKANTANTCSTSICSSSSSLCSSSLCSSSYC
eukprot:GHVT01026202.1.p2 GENE.GHVT01026202.1~~GHVT01026202.1.p2  ORF type:complete len:132 (+),score=28.09 GHVT01026202.1:50-445(+)